MSEAIDRELDALDRAIDARGIAIWIGGEPTFTDASSFAPEWNGAALGGDKEARARALIGRVARARPHAILMRSVGRQYGGEDRPRWSYGLWERRDHEVVWSGPRDPIVADTVAGEADARALAEHARDAIAEAFASDGCGVAVFEGEHDLRIAIRADGTMPDPEDERLVAPSLHDTKTPESGLDDALGRIDRTWLFRLRAEPLDASWSVRLELPFLGDVPAFVVTMRTIARALEPLAMPSLILAGFPPPTDRAVAWATVTPDPAVIEVNGAPSASARAHADQMRVWHEAAREEGLAPRRLFYDGEVGDSGGGGQLTIGGPDVESSPFFVAPMLLPRLVAYLQRHPSLSYLFAVDNVGPWSQSPRADEGLRPMVRELERAMASIDGPLDRAALQGRLGPFLRDATGNAHRAEINVEKLWNADLPGRGRLGLVELRALRMARSPERAAALGALVRAIAAMLATTEIPLALHDLGDALHDAWTLPSLLVADLEAVLGDLRAAGLPLGPTIEAELRDHPERHVGSVDLDGAILTITRAIEIWPLVGDAGSQEQRAARWIDASTRRLELRVDGAIEGIRIAHRDRLIPLRATAPDRALAGARFRAFAPSRGLHPHLPPQMPLELHAWREGAARATSITIHDWRPGGGAYDGLPRTDAEALARRAERFVVGESEVPSAAPATRAGTDAFVTDLRR